MFGFNFSVITRRKTNQKEKRFKCNMMKIIFLHEIEIFNMKRWNSIFKSVFGYLVTVNLSMRTDIPITPIISTIHYLTFQTGQEAAVSIGQTLIHSLLLLLPSWVSVNNVVLCLLKRGGGIEVGGGIEEVCNVSIVNFICKFVVYFDNREIFL